MRKELQRRAVLETAGQLLADEGPEALTMRALAKRLGASTSVLYANSCKTLHLDLGEGGTRTALIKVGR